MKNNWETIDLCGSWQLGWQEQEEYLSGFSPRTREELERLKDRLIPGTVPGNFELDLQRAGLLEEPFYGENILEAQKLEGRHLYYARSFLYEKRENTEPVLVFEGIDTVAELFLNGCLLGTCDNMLVPQEFPAERFLQEGENQLVVHIFPACFAARGRKVSAGNHAQKYNYETLRLRKAPHMFGWDIMPRLVSGGIFRPARLEYRPKARFLQAYLMTASVELQRKAASLQLFYEITTPDADLSSYEIELSGSCGESGFRTSDRLWFTAGKLDFSGEGLRFWWPKGYGEQPLYEVTLLLKKGGRVLDTCRFRTGLRTVALKRTGTTSLDRKGTFGFEVNGKKVFLLGTNFVPLDAFHSRDRERLPRVMELLEDVGCNAVRCWGGNVYEDDAFYDRCDELGILVWQDFVMACGSYPTDPEFCRVMEQEAETVIRRLRQHPCLLVWAGDNECDAFIRSGKFPRDPNRNVVTRQTLRNAVEQEDPTRPYLPSSPYIDEEAAALGDERFLTECHLWGPRDYFKSRFYTESLCSFVSEIGYHGCPSRSSLEKFLPPEKLWPYQGNSAWIVHAASPEAKESGVYAYRVELMAKQVRELFGQVPEKLDDFILASQISQAEAKKFFIEMFRMDQPYRTGILWWNLIDGWPQFSDAVVDYYFEKKLAYEYIRRVQQPMLLAVGEPACWGCELRLVNDTGKACGVRCRAVDFSTGETAFEQTVLAGPGVTVLGRLPYSLGEKKLWVLEWEWEGKTGKNHYLAGNPPFSLEKYRAFLKEVYHREIN